MLRRRAATLAALAALALTGATACHRDRDDAGYGRRGNRGEGDVPIAGTADRDAADRDADQRDADQRDADSADAADERDARDAAGAHAGHPARDASSAVVITTYDGNVDLGLDRDTVFMRLSDRVLTKARKGLDTQTTADGFGAWIEKTVKGKVAEALQHRIAYPLDDIDDVRYEHGAIRFTYRDRHPLSFEELKIDKRPVLESFTPDDARRFVAAVRAAKRRSVAGG
jgi:hypothetical protein